MAGSDINPNIFRAYDIRGMYGKDLDERIMERIGNAFASLFVKDAVVVGMDGRKSSPGLKKALIDGVIRSGKDVIDVGMLPRGVYLFFAWKRNLPSAYITASHLGKEWNGIKFAYSNGIELFEPDNYKVRNRVLGGKSHDAKKPGRVEKAEPIEDYKRFVLSKVGRTDRPLRVVMDCGNGVAGMVAPDLFEQAGFEVATIFGDVDGNFPNRPPDIDESDLSRLIDKSKHSDMGIVFDGDGDRLKLLDDKGRIMGPEAVSYLILRQLTKEEKGPIIANVECLKVMDEIAEKQGRDIYRVRVGNSFLVQAVFEHGACFGVERSGHFCVPSIIPVDDALAVSLYAAKILSGTGKRLSDIVDEIPLYPFKRLKVDCADDLKFKVIESLKKKLASRYEHVNTIDGVRVDFDYGWALIRASNTGPVIRISIEAVDEVKIKKLSDEFLGILKKELEGI
ncbi:MAG: phosphomannomutase/phosphoglucomutase [Candidatus Aenigmarchaeota archaeon]|nr:phosphomannomutase/phosphoglucomutase [Candidatus Aenigmarchaeota archaeon]